jgi:capsule polysaccharide export protein KpsE/RkpR
VRRPAPRFTVAPEVVRLENKIAAKRRTISDLEEFRQRRLAELQAQLVQYQAMYADAHPAVVTLRQNIEALSAPSPQIEALRREVQDLDRELMAQGVETPVSISARPRLSGEDLGNAATAGAATVNPREEFEKYQTRMVFQNYANVLDRIDAARVEMDAAQAAFKYRYSVISPPQMPKRPLKPSPLNVFGAGLVGGLLLALFASVRADLRKGLIVESWQIERSLGIPILAESR